jgi:chromosome segregation ATPase
MSIDWNDIRYYAVRGDNFQYGYTVKPQKDGKFHAVVVKDENRVRDIACGRRKVAKARAERWYDKREATLKKQLEAARARREMKEKNKPKPTPTEKKINMLKDKIANAQKRQRKLWEVRKQAKRRERRALNACEKWLKKEQQWTKQLQELQSSTDQRVTAFVREFKKTDSGRAPSNSSFFWVRKEKRR